MTAATRSRTTMKTLLSPWQQHGDGEMFSLFHLSAAPTIMLHYGYNFGNPTQPTHRSIYKGTANLTPQPLILDHCRPTTLSTSPTSPTNQQSNNYYQIGPLSFLSFVNINSFRFVFHSHDCLTGLHPAKATFHSLCLLPRFPFRNCCKFYTCKCL